MLFETNDKGLHPFVFYGLVGAVVIICVATVWYFAG